MKTVLSLVVALCGINFFASGQAQTTNAEVEAPARVVEVANPDETAKAVANHINSIVKLSPEQYAKVMEVAKTGLEKRQARLSSSIDNDNPTGMLVNADATDMEQQILSILNPEQIKLLEAQAATGLSSTRSAIKVSNNAQLQKANPTSDKK